MRKALALFIASIAFIMCMLIAWYAGIDFNERGVIQAVALSVSIWIASETYDYWK